VKPIRSRRVSNKSARERSKSYHVSMWDATNNSLLVKRKGSKINKRRSKIEEMEGTGR